MRDMTDAELHLFYNENKCPSCGEWKFLEGPTGAACMNVRCDNCGIELNIIPGGTQFMIGQVIKEPEGYVPPVLETPPTPRLPPVTNVNPPSKTTVKVLKSIVSILLTSFYLFLIFLGGCVAGTNLAMLRFDPYCQPRWGNLKLSIAFSLCIGIFGVCATSSRLGKTLEQGHDNETNSKGTQR